MVYLQFTLGQELSVKPFSLLSTNRASLAHGGPKGGPADDERHHQKLRQEVFYERNNPYWPVP
jgi:hypothetical protein